MEIDNTSVRDIAKARTIAVMASIVHQLDKNIKGSRPIVAMISKAQEEASAALEALVFVNPADIKAVMGLQNEVLRFYDIIRWITILFNEGVEADMNASEEERDYVEKLVLGNEELSQLQEDGHDA